MDTKIYMGPRGCGKTTALIMKSAETGATIIAPSRYMADCIRGQAKEMGYDIPEPLSVDEFLHIRQNPGFMKTNILHKGVLIDEAQIILQLIFGPSKIWGITVNDYDNIEYLDLGNQHNEEWYVWKNCIRKLS